MRENAKSDWSTGEKREWSTPKIREIPLTGEILAHFKLPDSASLTDVRPAKKTATGR